MQQCTCHFLALCSLMRCFSITVASNAYQSGLSYRASGGLLVGVPGGQAGGLVHYALYERGGIL
jgi:hypothetical protein